MNMELPDPIGPIPELEITPATAARVGRQLRRVQDGVGEVLEWAAGRSADGAGWTGNAATAASHTATRFSRNLAVGAAAVLTGADAADDLADDLKSLDVERDDLDVARIAFNQELAEAVRPVQPPLSVDPMDAFTQPRLGRPPVNVPVLRLWHLQVTGAIGHWKESVRAAEERFITSLEAIDTVVEVKDDVKRLAVMSDLGGYVDQTVQALVRRGILPDEAAGMSPEQLRAYLLAHPEVARDLSYHDPGVAALTGMEKLLADATLDPALAQELFDTMSPADADMVAMLYPWLVGNTNGIPFETRIDANEIRVAAELHTVDQVLPGWEEGSDQREDLEKMQTLYRSILDDDRKIILFDPGAEKIAELHGTIGPETKNVGVYVPGTLAEVSKFQESADRAQSFVDAAREGELAMISWQGGEFPPGKMNAIEKGYAETLAPQLADFSQALRMEIEHSGAGLDTRVGVGGHSYGGAVVGLSETYGLNTDRVLHIESAGMGHHVDDPSDLPASQANVDRYSMTDEDDFIQLVQGKWLSHGADPDTFDGNMRLASGPDRYGEPIEGPFHSHTAVFEPYSDPWREMLAFYTGGVVTQFDPDRVGLPGALIEDTPYGKYKVDIE